MHSDDEILSTFTAADGANIALRDWPLAQDAASRGMLLVLHGLGEHSGRYGHLARQLNGWGFSVCGFDQYGHGESDGPRGALSSPTRLLDDLADVVARTRAALPPALPLILLGHSMGGLVSCLAVASRPLGLQGLVLSSPALDPGLSRFQKLLLSLLLRVAPDLRVGNGLDARFISHDPEVVAAYRADPLVHDRITARLARFIADGGQAVQTHARQWALPTLLMYAGRDRLVDPQGSRDFAAAAPSAVVSVRCFPDLYHEIFNEAEAGPVFDCLKAWLDARFPAAA